MAEPITLDMIKQLARELGVTCASDGTWIDLDGQGIWGMYANNSRGRSAAYETLSKLQGVKQAEQQYQ